MVSEVSKRSFQEETSPDVKDNISSAREKVEPPESSAEILYNHETTAECLCPNMRFNDWYFAPDF